jgi:transposase
MSIVILGIDLGKNSCSIVGLDANGSVVVRRRMRRDKSRYLRKMLIQGARSAMPTLAKSDTATGSWPRALLTRTHSNVAVVALAAKMARTVWALLRHGGTYRVA